MEFMFAFMIPVGILGLIFSVDQLRKSIASDSAKVQALLAEIHDKLGK
jgi:hypothetical protein